MYPSLPDNPGILIRDKKFKIGQEIRDALKRREILFLVAKPKPKTKEAK